MNMLPFLFRRVRCPDKSCGWKGRGFSVVVAVQVSFSVDAIILKCPRCFRWLIA